MNRISVLLGLALVCLSVNPVKADNVPLINEIVAQVNSKVANHLDYQVTINGTMESAMGKTAFNATFYLKKDRRTRTESMTTLVNGHTAEQGSVNDGKYTWTYQKGEHTVIKTDNKKMQSLVAQQSG